VCVLMSWVLDSETKSYLLGSGWLLGPAGTAHNRRRCCKCVLLMSWVLQLVIR
jgi:hypothetical protein